MHDISHFMITIVLKVPHLGDKDKSKDDSGTSEEPSAE